MQVDVPDVAQLPIPQRLCCTELLVQLLQPNDHLLLLVTKVVVQPFDVLQLLRISAIFLTGPDCSKQATSAGAPREACRKTSAQHW